MPQLVWGSLGLTYLVAFGYTVYEKLKALNDKHAFISWSEFEVEIKMQESPTEGHETVSEVGGLGEMEGVGQFCSAMVYE